MLKIITAPNKILNKQLKPVQVVDKRIKQIVKEMTETLRNLDNPKGVGLAANQVSIDLAIFVFRQKNRIRPIINPKLISHSEQDVLDVRGKSTMLEGCLSIPKYYGTVKRFDEITIEYLLLDGTTTIETFKMPEAVIIQHEMDHLSGHLFIEKLLSQKGILYKVETNKEGKDELVEVEL